MNELERLKAEIERVQKQAAAMREALASIAEDKALVAFGHNANPMASRLGGIAAAALGPDAGRDYVHKDRLVDALKSIETEKKQAAALRGALVRLCNSWSEGTERENYEAMKEAKAALERAPHGETKNT